VTNYQAVVAGLIKPQLASSDPEMVRGLFAGIRDFQVIFPRMKECTLVGGVMNEFSGIQLAHVLYSHDTEVVYMYQTCWQTVMAGDKLNLPEAAKEELARTGWYSEELSDGNSIVLWKKGRTLCSAVARMSKNDLLACLADAGGNGGSPW
jgi:predicted  nucleic acid-binding Zn ribbon protein